MAGLFLLLVGKNCSSTCLPLYSLVFYSPRDRRAAEVTFTGGELSGKTGANDRAPRQECYFGVRQKLAASVLGHLSWPCYRWHSYSRALERLKPLLRQPEVPTRVLRPGDIVRLKIWREPDLSGDFRVDEQNVAYFPKIGALTVGLLLPDSLQRLLISSYSKFLSSPAVEVTFLRRINVLGAVRTPGLYHVDATMTVADALAMAGGVTSEGNPNKIRLSRGQPRMSTQLDLQTLLIDTPLQSGDQLRVPLRSWVSRNAGVVVGAVMTVATVVYYQGQRR